MSQLQSYRGKLIDQMTREELVDALEYAARRMEKAEKERDDLKLKLMEAMTPGNL